MSTSLLIISLPFIEMYTLATIEVYLCTYINRVTHTMLRCYLGNVCVQCISLSKVVYIVSCM